MKKLTLQDIVAQYGEAYRAKFKPPPLHQKVLDAILHCRTAALGGHVQVCTNCGVMKVHYNSCGNRHCPGCQAFKKEQWVEARQAELLPVPYLHVVFTLPHELNALVLSNDRLMYSMLFEAAWQTVCQLAEDPRWLGAHTGMIAVLHTWGSALSFHPHLHCVIPAGGLSKDGKKWVPTRKKRFLAPNKKVIAPIFKAKFMALLTRASEEEQLQFFGDAKQYADMTQLRQLLRKVNSTNWVVYAKRPFGGPKHILRYLSRYTHRIAISNRRILKCENAQVTFTYKNYRKKEKGKPAPIPTMVLSVFEFLRRFLMHVLPKGFQRIRYYGILAPVNRGTKLRQAQRCLNYAPPVFQPLDWQERLVLLTGVHPDTCPHCGLQTMQTIDWHPPTIRPPPVRIQLQHPLPDVVDFSL